MNTIPSWIVEGTGSSVLNGAGGLTERARLYGQICGPAGSRATSMTGNVSACCDLRLNRGAQGTIVPPPSIYLNDKLNGCAVGAVSASEARRLAALALSGTNQFTEDSLIRQKVAQVEQDSTNPFSTSTRFVAYRGPFIPPACAPTPPPPINPYPPGCPPPPGSRGF